jgi:hypothetical protein
MRKFTPTPHATSRCVFSFAQGDLYLLFRFMFDFIPEIRMVPNASVSTNSDALQNIALK